MHRRGARRLAAAALLVTLVPAPSAADPVERGRALYHGERATQLAVRLGGRTVPAIGLSCAGCHGRDATGGRERRSGPAIEWATLTAAAPHRTAYDIESFAQAVTEGLSANGEPLAATMPRFVFAATNDIAALAAYLGAVATEQRSGLDLASVRLLIEDFPSGSQGAKFRDAFTATVATLAPYGIYGRSVTLVTEAPAFATLAASLPGRHRPMPDLFPTLPLLGNEDARDVRSAFAPIAPQIEALMGQAATGTIVADPRLRARLEPLLAMTPGWAWDDVVPETGAVIALDAASLASALGAPRKAPVLTLGAITARIAAAVETCLLVADPFAPPDADEPATAPPAVRFGRAAAIVFVEALKNCGPDCTRAGLMEGFETIRTTPAAWPALDYGSHPLTGTTDTKVRRLCAEAPSDGSAPRSH